MAYTRGPAIPSTPIREDESSSSSSSSLAAKAIRASSAAHPDSSLSSAYSPSNSKDSTTYGNATMRNSKESKYGFWGNLARKAKAILEDDDETQQFEKPGTTRPQMLDTSVKDLDYNSYPSHESHRETDSPTLRKGLNAITSSLNYIGGTIGNALEGGLTAVENRTADVIQETRKLHIRKTTSSETQNQAKNVFSARRQQPAMQAQIQNDQEIQLKASRDVAMAMAAKAKLLLRELKTIKADLAFAKDRCAQLEEENRILRESRNKGDNPEDDDLIRLQLETLLAEKARLAHENSIHARENRFLREIVEYHQLTMQDVVYLDEGMEEVTEVCPTKVPILTKSTGDTGC